MGGVGGDPVLGGVFFAYMHARGDWDEKEEKSEIESREQQKVSDKARLAPCEKCSGGGGPCEIACLVFGRSRRLARRRYSEGMGTEPRGKTRRHEWTFERIGQSQQEDGKG